MRLKQFLLIEGRTKPIDQDEAISFIQENCKQALKMYNENREIYRSITDEYKSTPFKIGDSSKFKRTSAYTKNYYTMLLDNLPEWKKFPKRSRSFIGSSTIERATSHGGTLYVAFPVDGTKIGVCPKDDIWGSFGELRLSQFNRFLEDFFYNLLHQYPNETNWKKLKTQFKSINKIIKANPELIEVTFIKKYHKDNLFNAVREYLNPDKNKFQLKEIGDKLSKNKEIWWSGRTVFIKYDDKILPRKK